MKRLQQLFTNLSDDRLRIMILELLDAHKDGTLTSTAEIRKFINEYTAISGQTFIEVFHAVQYSLLIEFAKRKFGKND